MDTGLNRIDALTTFNATELITLEQAPVLGKKVVGKEDIDIAALIRRLGNSDWVRQGLTYVNDAGSQCPFCQQDIDADLAAKLNEYFDEAYTADIEAIDRTRDAYNTYSQAIRERLEAIHAGGNQYLDLDAFRADIDRLTARIDLNLRQLDRKRKEASAQITLEGIADVASSLEAAISTANAEIARHNAMVDNLTTERAALISEIWKCLLEESRLTFTDYDTAKTALDRAVEGLRAGLATKQAALAQARAELAELERTVTSVQPTVTEINGILRSFGFTGFNLATAGEHQNLYEIVRGDGSQAASTLSEGERSFITFLYFYHLIRGSMTTSGMNTPRVIVFDDPVSSLDSDVLFIVSALIKRVLEEACTGVGSIRQVYAPNPSFDASLNTLEKHHVLIISGPPGVGKTTLAEMLSYAFLGEDWQLVPIRSLDDGFAAIDDSKKQIFFFDDFLGRVALDKQALSHKDSDLARFMGRVRRSPNARFILTTRGYIFEEARQVSEYLADTRLDVSKYVLDVGIYTRRIKARILYNHLLVAGTPKPLIGALIETEIETLRGKKSALSMVIDHKNYNPRVIEYMTDVFRMGDISAENYPNAFLKALDNPSQIWDTAFRTHIDHKCRHLLIAMFFASEYGVDIVDLRILFDTVHAALSVRYGLARGPKDFEEALRTLEGSFVSIRGSRVSYVNPSLKDYLTGYLTDADLLSLLAPSAKTVEWANALWAFTRRQFAQPGEQKRVAQGFAGVVDIFHSRPVWKQSKSHPHVRVHGDEPNSTRIRLLVDWWRVTSDQRFAERALEVAKNPTQGFSSWRDSENILDVIFDVDDPESGSKFVYADEIKAVLEEELVKLIRWSMPSDELASLADAVDMQTREVPSEILSALEKAVAEEFDEIEDRVSDEDSESSLTDRIDTLKKLAPRYGIPDDVLSRAISKIEDRISEIEEEATSSSSPDFKSSDLEADLFDDTALRNLFTPLLDD